MFQVKIIDSLESLFSIEETWNNLYSQCNISYPFLTFEWVTTWWRCFGKENRLFVMVITKNKETIAIAPFMYTKKTLRKIPLKTITFLTNYHSNRMEMMIIKDKQLVIEYIFHHLSNLQPRIDLIELNFIPEKCQDQYLIENTLRTRELRYLKYTDFQSPYLTINNPWDDYFKNRPRRLKQKIKSTKNKHKNDIEIKKYTEYSNECMEDLYRISSKTWKYKENSAIVSQKETKEFYTTLAKIASEKNWLDILILKFQGTPIAFDFKLIFNEINYCLKIGYDLDYKKYTPGQFLMAQSIQNSFEDGLKEYDFVGAKFRSKMEWTDSLRNHYKYLIFSKSLFGSFASFVELNLIRKFKLNELYHSIIHNT